MFQNIWACRNITSIYFYMREKKKEMTDRGDGGLSQQSQDGLKTHHSNLNATSSHLFSGINCGERDQQTKWIISSALNNSWIVSNMINWWFCLLAWGRSSFLKRLLRTSSDLHQCCSQVWMCLTECVTRWQKQEMLLSQPSPAGPGEEPAAGRSGGSDNTPLPPPACCGRRSLKAADHLQLLHTEGLQHELTAVLQYWHRVAGHSTASSSVSSVPFPPLPPCFLTDLLHPVPSSSTETCPARLVLH